jgi:acetoin utilization protein AcuB
MERWRIHHLLVEDRGCVVALLSDRDLLGRISPYAQTNSAQRRDDDTLRRRVSRAASYHLLTVRHSAPVQEAAALLIEHEISCLPVIDEHDHLIGIVTTRDLLRGMLECVVPTGK